MGYFEISHEPRDVPACRLLLPTDIVTIDSMNSTMTTTPPVPTTSETVGVMLKPELAKRTFSKEDVVLAYHGTLLYEAIVMDVTQSENSKLIYDLQYQGWMKCWNAKVLSDFVFEHNDTNLLIAHQLLRSAKARQQAIAPAVVANSSHPIQFENRNNYRLNDINNLSRPQQPEITHPIERYQGYARGTTISPDIDDEEDDMTKKFPGMLDRPRTVHHDGMLKRDRSTPDSNHPTAAAISDDNTTNLGSERQNTTTSSAMNEFDSDLEENENSTSSASLFYLPGTLKQQLVDDWEFITKENKLVPLPRKESVSMIIDKWVKNRQQSEDLACQEVADGLKAYFDAALPNMLLYKFERLQYNLWFHGPNAKAREHDEVEPKPSKFYGAEHLVRLLLKMPYMLESTGVVDFDMLRRIAEKTNELAQFLTDNGRLLFLPSYTSANKEYLERISKGNFGAASPMNENQLSNQPQSSPTSDHEEMENQSNGNSGKMAKEKR